MMERPIERVVEEFLVGAAPSSVPAGLHRAIVDVARRTPQRRTITVRPRRGSGASRTLLLAAAVAVAAAMLGVIWVGSPAPIPTPPVSSREPSASPSPSQPNATQPSPTGSSAPERSAHAFVGESNFLGFEYVAPENLATHASGLMYTIGLHEGAIGDTPPPGAYGMIIAVIDTPLVHGNSSTRVQIRSDPAGFLEDLVNIDDIPMRAPAPVTVDGVDALQADTDAEETNRGGDVHLTDGLFYGFFINPPARVIALETGGHHLAVVIWAADDETFAEWLPTAQRIVGSIRFDR